MKTENLSKKTAEELSAELIKLRESQFKLRMKKATGQLGQTHLLKANKKSIARIKTAQTQMGSGK